MMNADERLTNVLKYKLGIEVSELAVGHEIMWLRKIVHEIWLVNDEIQSEFLDDLKSRNL